MPKVLTRDSLSEVVMTATRSSDVDRDERFKAYTAGVIRFWIEGWGYGTIFALPFVVLPHNKKIGHYEEHVCCAAGTLELPVLYIFREVWEALPFPPGPEPRPAIPGQRRINEWHLWARGWISAFTKTGAFDEQGK